MCCLMQFSYNNFLFFFLYKYIPLWHSFFLLNFFKNQNSANKIKFKNNFIFKFKNKIIFKFFNYSFLIFSTKTIFNIFFINNDFFFFQNMFMFNINQISNYLYLLLFNTINFLFFDTALLLVDKIIFYSLLYTVNDLKKYNWFFTFEKILIDNNNWYFFMNCLINKFKICYLIIFNEKKFMHQTKFNIFDFNVKISFLYFFNTLGKHDYYFFFKGKWFFFIILRYLIHLASLILWLKKIWHTYLIPIQYYLPNTHTILPT